MLYYAFNMNRIYKKDRIGESTRRVLNAVLPLGATAMLLGGCASAEAAPTPIKPAVYCELVPHWVGKQSLNATVLDPDLKAGQTFQEILIHWGDGSEDIVTSQPGDDAARNGLSTTEPHHYLSGEYTVSAEVEVTLASGQPEVSTSGASCMYVASVPQT